jgi:uncharacterized membrane protein YphA (DoxX/SURF4 family)
MVQLPRLAAMSISAFPVRLRNEGRTEMTLIRNNSVLWTMQILLAALYLFAGGFKLVADPSQMVGTPGTPELPLLFIRFIGLMEVLGAIGLVVPWLTGIKAHLTPLAAWGLVVIMAGATIIGIIAAVNVPSRENVFGLFFPFVVGLLVTVVATGRGRTVTRQYAAAA